MALDDIVPCGVTMPKKLHQKIYQYIQDIRKKYQAAVRRLQPGPDPSRGPRSGGQAAAPWPGPEPHGPDCRLVFACILYILYIVYIFYTLYMFGYIVIRFFGDVTFFSIGNL